MTTSTIKCVCQDSSPVDFNDRITAIERLRNQCPAIKLLLIPDLIWENYKAVELAPRDKARHISITLKSILEGDIAKLTLPLHRYLLNSGQLINEVIKQYREDLQEKWMFQIDEISRHKKFKIFTGKLVELDIAQWLEQTGWQIENLAALGGETDIQCSNLSENADVSIEVKYIGERDEEFQQGVNALQGLPAGGRAPMYQILNYILFRTYEAAHQFNDIKGNRIAIIVVDSLMWVYFNIPFKNGFLNFNKPSSFDLGEDWNNFINGKRKKYPDIDTDLFEKIKTLNEIWVVVKDGYSYRLKLRHQWDKCT